MNVMLMRAMAYYRILPGLFVFLASCMMDKSDTASRELTDINHIIHMGQSLGAGEQSLPIVTDVDTGFGNLKFSMGTHTWSNDYYPGKPWLRKKGGFSFVPLTAQQRGAEGETIANGMCDHLSQTMKNLEKRNSRFLFSFAGQGGRYLRELDKQHDDAKDERAGRRKSGGGYYKTSIDDVAQAKSMADSLGLSYSVFAVTWMQGEAESGLRVNRWDPQLSRNETIETYKKDLIQLKNDYQKDIVSVTHQSNQVPFFTYQTFGTLAATAQLMACDQEKEMYMVAPTYMLPNAENGFYDIGGKLLHGDGIHLTADGERWLGEQFGKVMRKVVTEGKNWQPMRPLRSWYGENEKSVFVKFHAPAPPIVIDSVFLPKQGKGLGFEVYDNNGHIHPIKKVRIIDDNCLQIELTAKLSPKDSLLVRYGLNTYVAEIPGTIKFVNPTALGGDGYASVEIGFEGNILHEFVTLLDEGVFYLNNTEEGEGYTNLIVREVLLDTNGDTILKGESDDLRNRVNFRVGQTCFTSRRYGFGNIRDSDHEKSTYTFKDDNYGKRQGENYPLWNWSVAFQDMVVRRVP